VNARAALFVLLLVCCDFAACKHTPSPEYQQVAQLTGGDARAGRQLLREKGCVTCHTLQSVPGARGLVGPPLDGIADRSYLAGELANTPENMVTWIEHPHQVEPKTVMPEMGLSEQESRDIAAYLYTQHTTD
jgi:cytochrome c2